MSRLERAARDAVVAILSHPSLTADHALSWAGAVCLEPVCLLPREPPQVHPRLVRARLALWLRLQRRVEAWERARLAATADTPDEWAIPVAEKAEPFPDPHDGGSFTKADFVVWRQAYERWCALPYRHQPWNPLWVSAPPFDPAITPAMRRDER